MYEPHTNLQLHRKLVKFYFLILFNEIMNGLFFCWSEWHIQWIINLVHLHVYFKVLFLSFFVEVYKDAALFSCLLKFDLQVTVRYFLWSALFSTDKYVLFTFVRSCKHVHRYFVFLIGCSEIKIMILKLSQILFLNDTFLLRVQFNTSSAPTVFIPLHSIHVHTVENLTSKISFMNMHEARETNLLLMKSHGTIKYSSISMTSYRDFRTENRKCSEVRMGQGPWPVARLAQMVRRAADRCTEGPGFESHAGN